MEPNHFTKALASINRSILSAGEHEGQGGMGDWVHPLFLPVSTTPAAKLPPVSTTSAANFDTSFTSVVDTGGKFATGVNDTGGKRHRRQIATSINDTGDKFATGVINIRLQIP